MPQLSPMMGVVIFATVLFLLFTFMSSASKKPAKINKSKTEMSFKSSMMMF